MTHFFQVNQDWLSFVHLVSKPLNYGKEILQYLLSTSGECNTKMHLEFFCRYLKFYS